MPHRLITFGLLALATTFFSSQLHAYQATTVERPAATSQQQQRSNIATSKKNMVASVHPRATQAGLDAFEKGGNAVDAAIATALTLGVVDNFNSGIGGGCFILIRTADGEFFAIDGREMAPAAANKNLYRNAKGPIPDPSRTGALASGVPGALMAYSQAIEKHGRLGLRAALRPGAFAAYDGFTVTKAYAAKLKLVEKPMSRFPAAAEIFFRENADGNGTMPYQFGEKLVQKDLAETYKSVAQKGLDWFYRGEFAEATERWMKANDGIMTAEDFANYTTVDRTPVRTTYRGYEIIGFPPPSSGGVHVAQVLNILEQFDLKQLYADEPAKMYHVVAEAMKLAFADRAYWLGDPDFVEVPLGLIDKSYAIELAKKIDLAKTALVTQHGMPPNADAKFFECHTTHVAAADINGNWVALTTTVNTTFGAKFVIPGTGVIMNNQMDDFVAIPGKPNAFGLVGGAKNAVDAKKRPLSSMSPTIVLKDGQPVLTIGAAGGPKIITEVLWGIINHLDLGMPIGEAIGQPRLHHQWSPSDLLESNFDTEITRGLISRNHSIKKSSGMGICQGITFDPVTQTFTGAHDPRTTGKAIGQ